MRGRAQRNLGVLFAVGAIVPFTLIPAAALVSGTGALLRRLSVPRAPQV